MASEEDKDRETTGREGSIYVTKVSAEHGNIIEQITNQLTKETDLVEKADFMLVANQKNKTKKPIL